jgi:hypothetical protein
VFRLKKPSQDHHPVVEKRDYGKSKGSAPSEEEKPDHHPDEGHHQQKGRHKESYHPHVPTVLKERPGGFRRGVSTKD